MLSDHARDGQDPSIFTHGVMVGSVLCSALSKPEKVAARRGLAADARRWQNLFVLGINSGF